MTNVTFQNNKQNKHTFTKITKKERKTFQKFRVNILYVVFEDLKNESYLNPWLRMEQKSEVKIVMLFE